MIKNFKDHFEKIVESTFLELLDNEALSFGYYAERSNFMRFNHCKVRQTGNIEQCSIQAKFYKDSKTFSFEQTLTGTLDKDEKLIAEAISKARITAALLPADPYQAVPSANEKSNAVYSGKLLSESEIPSKILTPAEGLDFTGLYTQGSMCRGAANSFGAKHWFQTEAFSVDFSAWLPNGRAVKSSYSGRQWNDQDYATIIKRTRESLNILNQEPKVLQPGKYRAFITADALNETIEFFSWNGLGEREIRQGESAYIAMREGKKELSKMFNLNQDFSLGVEPAFNSDGELAPEKLELIKEGKLINTIINSRTAKQYNLVSTGGNNGESVCSISIGAGSLSEADAIKALGTGIYVSNFHYLNWSDVPSGRITGMTRFSCLWVEDGKIVAPIKDMRWDDSIYNMFGSKLEAITKERHLIMANTSYEYRDVGGSMLPGILVTELNCTL